MCLWVKERETLVAVGLCGRKVDAVGWLGVIESKRVSRRFIFILFVNLCVYFVGDDWERSKYREEKE